MPQQVKLTTPGAPINQASQKPVNTSSGFMLSYPFFDTHRFGEYHPHFYDEGVPKDKDYTLQCKHRLLSYTLGSPLMQDIMMKKDYFAVPLSAVLPINWEKWYKNPNRGDDVADEVGCTVPQFWLQIAAAANTLRTSMLSYLVNISTPHTALTVAMRFMTWLEMFYSDGSLLKSLKISGSQFFKYYNNDNLLCFDDFFDEFITTLKDTIGIETVIMYDADTAEQYYIDFTGTKSKNRQDEYNWLTVHGFLSMYRDNLNFAISSVTYDEDKTATDSAFCTAILDFFTNTADRYYQIVDQGLEDDSDPIELTRVFAYQIACAHFYSNENVDDIYSAELYRELIRYCLIGSNGTQPTFNYNGMSVPYDACSGYMFLELINDVNNVGFLSQTSDSYSRMRGYFSNVFSFRRSLRYMDYFTGARTQPLAVGNAVVAANEGVNVIDMAAGFQKTRFWNAVARVGSKIRDYFREVIGVDLPSDIHDPYFLGHTTDSVFAQEVENTGDLQFSKQSSITSVLRGSADRYAFRFDVDVPVCLIGITYYDIERVYTHATDRLAISSNRFDKFNSYLQFVGDQSIKGLELGTTFSRRVFGYTLRDMQYKQKYAIAAGGFVRNLPGYAFYADNTRFGSIDGINAEFVRSLQSELDDYYVSLTGYSLGSYFHFQVKNVNVASAIRPMAWAPSIL